jgi:hypothetical protein
MNKLQLKGEWHELIGKIRQKFADLTDNDGTMPRARKKSCLAICRRSLAVRVQGS